MSELEYWIHAKIYHIKCMWISELHFMASDSVLHFEDFLMEECCTEDIDSVQH